MIVCRTCLSRHNLVPLFGEPSVEKFSSDQLFLATGVKIQLNDGLSQVACKSCITKIKNTLHFQHLSSKVDEMLKELSVKHPVIKTEELDDDGCHKMTQDIFNTTNMSQDTTLVKNQFSNIDLKNIPIEYNDIVNIKPIFADTIDMNYDSDETNVEDDYKDIDDNDSDKSNNKEQEISSNSKFDPKPIKEYMKKASTNVRSLLDMNKKLRVYTSNLRRIINPHKTNDNGPYAIKIRPNTVKKDLNRKIYKNKKNKVRLDTRISKDVVTEDNLSEYTHAIETKKKSVCSKTNALKHNFDRLTDTKYKGVFNQRKSQMYIEMEQRNKKLMALASPQSDGTTQCKQCNKVVRANNFKNHAKTHFEPEFSCDICGKTYFDRSQVNYHQQRHHGKEKRLQCPHCPFRAVDNFCMRNHVRAEHTGERPFECDVCGASFRMRANIAQHMHSHFGVRNVQCELCPAMFTRRSILWSHQMKTHFIDYTYYCYLCPETYKRPKPVRNHLLNVHGVPLAEQLNIKCVKSRKPEAPSSNSVGSKTFVPEVNNPLPS